MPGQNRKKADSEKTEEIFDDLLKRDGEVALADYMASFAPQGARFYVYRIVAGRHRYVATHDGAMTEEDILESYGPGTFLIRANIAGKWMGSRRVDIEGRQQAPDGSSVQTMTPDGSSREMFQIQMQMMQEQAQRTHEMMLAMIANMGKGGSSTDPALIMTSMITGLESMKRLSGGNGDELDRVSKILEIAEKIGGNGGGPKSTMETLLDAAKEILPGIMAARGILPSKEPDKPNAPTCCEYHYFGGDLSEPHRNESFIKPRPLPEPVKGIESTPAVSTGTDVVPVNDSQKQLSIEIKNLWLKIEKAAERDFEPEALAGSILDWAELDDKAAQVIIDSLLNTPNLDNWEKVTGPILEKLKPWFGRFYATVKELGKDEETETVKESKTESGPHV